MNKKTKKFFVSSADWEIAVDHINHRDAAISAILIAFKKFGRRLLMSTVIMVRDEKSKSINDVTRAEFFATHNLFQSLGLNSLSNSFKEYTKSINES